MIDGTGGRLDERLCLCIVDNVQAVFFRRHRARVVDRAWVGIVGKCRGESAQRRPDPDPDPASRLVLCHCSGFIRQWIHPPERTLATGATCLTTVPRDKLSDIQVTVAG